MSLYLIDKSIILQIIRVEICKYEKFIVILHAKLREVWFQHLRHILKN